MTGYKLNDLTEKVDLDGAEELYINDTSDSTDKKITVDQIRKLNSERFIYAEDYGVDSDNPDNTDQINAALAKCTKKGMAVVLPVKGDIKVQGALIFPANVQGITVCALGGQAVLDMTNHVGTLFTLNQRGQGVKNLIIKSTQRTGTAINFGGGTPTSQLHANNIYITNVANALIFDNCHDGHDISNVELFRNGSDIEFNNNQSTSVKMHYVRMMESESAITINRALGDFHFHDGIIAPSPVDMVDSCFTVNSAAIYGGSIKRTRFEVKNSNNPNGFWNQMSLNGSSSTYPISSFNIEDNYFTGAAANHISLTGSTRGISISNNFFMSDPDGVDIYMGTHSAEDYIGLGNLALSGREIRISYPSNLYYKARGWRAIKRNVDRHTVTIYPGDETVGYVETTVTWPVPFETQTLRVDTFFRSADAQLKTGTPYLSSFTKVSATLRVPVYATGSVAKILKFDVEAFGI